MSDPLNNDRPQPEPMDAGSRGPAPEDLYNPHSGHTPRPEMRNWLIGFHLSPLAGLVGIPFANLIAPLVLWLIKKDESPVYDEHGKEVLNFQISVTIYAIVCIVLSFLLIGIPMAIALFVFWVIMIIIGAMDASNGKLKRYPLTIRLLK